MSTYTITTSQDNTGVAPADHQWCAWFGEVDFDEGTGIGWGHSEAAAVRNLLNNFEGPWEEA